MKSTFQHPLICIAAVMLSMSSAILIPGSCSVQRRYATSGKEVSLYIPEDEDKTREDEMEVIMDSIRNNAPNDPLLMNAIRESETGELYATDIISASEVVARFKSVAERNGQVSISFDIKVPSEMMDSRWQLKFFPRLDMGRRVMELDPVFITGKKYREKQLRGYERYQRFIGSIILDSAYFVRKDLLEIFLQRNFPQIYAMKTDSSLVSDDMETRWGVSRKEVVEHYTRTLEKNRHRRKWARKDRMFRRFIKDPIPSDGIRLDSVVNEAGVLVYSYTQPLKLGRGVRKLLLTAGGKMYENGRVVRDIAPSDTLEFYITSLSSLMENIERRKMKIVYRQVNDSTKAFINFPSASYLIDTSYLDNAAELARVGRCIEGVVSREEMVLDSLVITAFCSPEGRYGYNARLAGKRSEAIREYVGRFLPDSLKSRLRADHVPENWEGLCRGIRSDTLISPARRKRLLDICGGSKEEPDQAEKMLSVQKEYRHLREKVYPALRAVSFDFHLHRPDMAKDTIHTAEVDSVYMDGLECIRNMDYKSAVARLRSYHDYNAALACVLADYNHSALEILKDLEDDAKTTYLKALVYARLGFYREALAFLDKSIVLDPTMKFRAGLDPELSLLTHKYLKV